MGLRSLLVAGAEAVLTGLLEHEISPVSGRLRPGGYDRALAATRERMGLGRYDWTVLRSRIGPSVRGSIRAANRARADPESIVGRLPLSPRSDAAERGRYEYIVRYREPASGPSGRRDTVFAVYSDAPMSADTVMAEAIRLVRESEVQDTLQASLGLEPLAGVGEAIVIRAYRT